MHISKKNEVYLVLSDLDPSTVQELSEFFTFEVPGAKFMPTYRNRIWDGKIRLFSPQTGQIYVGLLEYIKKFCDANNVKYTIEEGVEDVRDSINLDRWSEERRLTHTMIGGQGADPFQINFVYDSE